MFKNQFLTATLGLYALMTVFAQIYTAHVDLLVLGEVWHDGADPSRAKPRSWQPLSPTWPPAWVPARYMGRGRQVLHPQIRPRIQRALKRLDYVKKCCGKPI